MCGRASILQTDVPVLRTTRIFVHSVCAQCTRTLSLYAPSLCHFFFFYGILFFSHTVHRGRIERDVRSLWGPNQTVPSSKKQTASRHPKSKRLVAAEKGSVRAPWAFPRQDLEPTANNVYFAPSRVKTASSDVRSTWRSQMAVRSSSPNAGVVSFQRFCSARKVQKPSRVFASIAGYTAKEVLFLPHSTNESANS